MCVQLECESGFVSQECGTLLGRICIACPLGRTWCFPPVQATASLIHEVPLGFVCHFWSPKMLEAKYMQAPPSFKLHRAYVCLSYSYGHHGQGHLAIFSAGGVDTVGTWGLQPLAEAGIVSWAPVAYLQSTILWRGGKADWSRLEQIGADWSRWNCMSMCWYVLLIMRCLYALLICCDSLTSFSMFLHVSPRRLDLNRPPCFGGCFCLRWIVTLYNLTHIVGSVDASVQQDLPLSLQVIYYVIVALWLSSLIRVLCTRPVCSTVVVLCFSKFYPKTLRIFSRHMHDIIIYIRVYYIHTNTHRHTHTHIQIIYIYIIII